MQNPWEDALYTSSPSRIGRNHPLQHLLQEKALAGPTFDVCNLLRATSRAIRPLKVRRGIRVTPQRQRFTTPKSPEGSPSMLKIRADPTHPTSAEGSVSTFEMQRVDFDVKRSHRATARAIQPTCAKSAEGAPIHSFQSAHGTTARMPFGNDPLADLSCKPAQAKLPLEILGGVFCASLRSQNEQACVGDFNTMPFSAC